MAEVTQADFKAVKEAVSLVQVLEFYGVTLRKVNATTYRGKCPLPTHPAVSDKESLSVLVDKRMWVCHSTICNQNAKRKSGDVIDFVKIREGIDSRQAGIWLHAHFMSDGAQSGNQPSPLVANREVTLPATRARDAVVGSVASIPPNADVQVAFFRSWLGTEALEVLSDTTLTPDVRQAKLDVLTLVKQKADAVFV